MASNQIDCKIFLFTLDDQATFQPCNDNCIFLMWCISSSRSASHQVILFLVGFHFHLIQLSIAICLLAAIEEEQRQRKEKEINELDAFWRDYPLLITSAPEGSKLHDTAYDKVTIKNEWIPENLEDDKDGEKKVKKFLFHNDDIVHKTV